jgi:hypothetical protein
MVLTGDKNWSGKRDSNSRPQPWQGCALPAELFPLGIKEMILFKWCPGPESNRHDQKSQDFKSCVSTNFTTRASDDYIHFRTGVRKCCITNKRHCDLEAEVGIEPAYTELQSAAWPLCHSAKF